MSRLRRFGPAMFAFVCVAALVFAVTREGGKLLGEDPEPGRPARIATQPALGPPDVEYLGAPSRPNRDSRSGGDDPAGVSAPLAPPQPVIQYPPSESAPPDPDEGSDDPPPSGDGGGGIDE